MDSFHRFSDKSSENRGNCSLTKKLLTIVTKNPILDGAGVLQTHLGGAFLGWTLSKDELNKVQPGVVFFQKQELNPAPHN